MQAFAGFARANGARGEDVGAFRFTGFIDLTTAAVATEGILAALLEREISGEGQKVEISMLEAALEIEYTRIAELLGAGLVPSPRGSESPALAPDGAYPALDYSIFVTAHDDGEWRGLCAAIEKPELAYDERFATNRARVTNRKALNALLAPVIAARPAIWWLRIFQRNGVPANLAHHFETFRHHAQVVANDMIACLETPQWGAISVGGLPWHFSGTPCAVTAPAQPGEHTDEVLASLRPGAQKLEGVA
jgi:crotonobetainyl-CoA:carnitine CoA-transferase CaiB-like acyl-CoA transferase